VRGSFDRSDAAIPLTIKLSDTQDGIGLNHAIEAILGLRGNCDGRWLGEKEEADRALARHLPVLGNETAALEPPSVAPRRMVPLP